MKHRLTYFLSVATVMLLCVVMLCGTVTPAAAQTQVAAASAFPSLQYGVEDEDKNTVLSATDLYERLFGKSPTEAESLYLESTGISFTYHSGIPANTNISTDYSGEDGVLLVTIRPYVFTAVNGSTVTWTPVSALIDGVRYVPEATEDVYTCRVENLFYSEDFDIKVDYTWSTEVPAVIIEEMRTAAYEKGNAALEANRAYESALKAYTEQLAAHEEWMAYQEWKPFWDAYLAKKAAYEAQCEAYETYCSNLEKYEEDLVKYEQWQEYFVYQDYLTNDLDDYNAYLLYQENIKVVEAKLALLDSLFVADSNGWRMYGSIMGSTVDKVLANEDLLVSSGNANPQDIRQAGNATDALRVLLPKYAELRNKTYATEHARLEALYGYYTQNYTALAKEFKNLYSALYALFDNGLVKLKLNEEGQLAHYMQFVGQLYVIATCLDENGSRDPNWLIAEKKLSEVVESVHRLEDGDWSPLKTAFLPYAPPVEPVAPVARPEGEMVTTKPTKPAPVSPPSGSAPTPPENPYESGIPKETAHPGKEPTVPGMDELTGALMKEVSAGTLTEYTGKIEPITLQFSTTATRPVSISNRKYVSFYHHDAQTLLAQVSVDYGSAANWPVPEREPTAQYVYEPLGWVDKDGRSVNLANITTDMDLYPSYSKILQYYDITWRYTDETGAENVHTSRIQYGAIPKVPNGWYDSAYEYNKEDYHYRFSGWSPKLAMVTQDATYTASMEVSLRTYNVTWELYDGISVTVPCEAGSTPVFSGDTYRAPDDTYLYTFTGWKEEIGPVHGGDVTYHAVYSKEKLAIGATNSSMKVEHQADALKVQSTQASLDVSTAARYAVETDKNLLLEWESGVQLKFTPDQMQSYLTSGCKRIVLQQKAESGEISYELLFYDPSWNTLDSIGAGVTVTLPKRENDGLHTTTFFLESAEGLTRIEGDTVTLTGSALIREVSLYSITYEVNENCAMRDLPSDAKAGEKITLNPACIGSYELISLEVLDADGEQIILDSDNSFTMPASPVTIKVQTAEIVYTVIFKVDGEIVSREQYARGDLIVLPEDPPLPEQEGYVFAFLGWGNVPERASGVQRTLVFEASFSKEAENVNYSTGNNNNLFLELYLPIAVVVLVLLIGGLITWRVLHKRKKKRRQQDREIAARLAMMKAQQKAAQTGESAEAVKADEKEPPAEE